MFLLFIFVVWCQFWIWIVYFLTVKIIAEFYFYILGAPFTGWSYEVYRCEAAAVLFKLSSLSGTVRGIVSRWGGHFSGFVKELDWALGRRWDGAGERLVSCGFKNVCRECFGYDLTWGVSLLSEEGEDWNFGWQWKHQNVSWLFQPLCLSFRAPWETNSFEQLY